MANIIKLRGPIREFTVAVGAYSRGGLLKICSSRVGGYSIGGLFQGGAIQGFTVIVIAFCKCLLNSQFPSFGHLSILHEGTRKEQKSFCFT